MYKRKISVYILFSILLSLTPVFSQQAGNDDKTVEEVMLIQALHENELFQIPGVNGVGIGRDENGKLVLHVYVKEEADLQLIPRIIGEVSVVFIASSDFYALDTCDPRPARCAHRDPQPFPVPGGVSTSNHLSCLFNTGTRGFKACDASDIDIVGYITNNHVAARGADGCPNRAPLGTAQYQPGTDDVGLCTDGAEFGGLERFVPINFGGDNRVDAAFVRSDNARISGTILDIGLPTTSPRTPNIGERVQKSGSTTGYTEGTVQTINWSGPVNYGAGCGGSANFTGQIIVTPGSFSAGGDSGSPVLDMSNNPVGLLFAGSSFNTVINPITNVISQLNVRFDCVCTYSISPTIAPARPVGGTGSVNVTAPSECNWTAVSNASWITITSGGSGRGNGTVTYSVSVNTGSGVRTGTMTIAGLTFTVVQHWVGGTIYVNRFYTGVELGTQSNPFRTVNAANNFAWDGAQIRIRAGSYPETMTFSKRLTVLADDGPVTIGR